MIRNINTKEYWDRRFCGSWESACGPIQTAQFAKENLKRMIEPSTFSGVLCDYGCALGDALPLYKHKFPRARLIGADISDRGIELCQRRYGDIASFEVISTPLDLPWCDIIIASNVIEHVTEPKDMIAKLLTKCSALYISVPYKEALIEDSEHVSSFDEYYFDGCAKCISYSVFSQ